ncbi:MAG: hypothetical protein ABIJ57_07560 [Pseudomonadota bacterium]
MTDVGAAIQEPVEQTDDQKEIKLPDDLAAWVITCIHGFRESAHRDTRARAKKAFDYFNNQQWDPAVKQAMEADKRPCVVFNEIRPKIEALGGEERRNREDWIAKPREGSDENEANVRTALLKYVRDINNLHIDESRSFEEEVIGGYGGLAAWLVDGPDSSSPPLIRVEYRPWHEYAWDWTSRARDFTDAQWMALATMISVSRLTEMFPDYEHQITEEYGALTSDPAVMQEDVGERIGVSRYKDGDMRGGLYSREGQQVQAVIFYYRVDRKIKYLEFGVPGGGMQTREIPEDDPDVKQMAAIAVETGRAKYVTKTEHGIKGCLVVGRRTLSTWWSPFRGTNAFGVPYFPIFVAIASDTNNYIMGLVESMIDPQNEINKRWSMTVENYLKQARSGGMYEDGAFIDEATTKKMWGSPGYWAKLKSGALMANKVKEHVAKPTDQALMLLFQHSEATMDRVSNIEKARMGLTSQETSGIAIKQRALQSALVQVKPFDNFRHLQLLLGRFLNANLQLMFPEQTILRLVMPDGKSQSVTLNQQHVVNGVTRVVNSTDGDLYDITMDLTPGNATFREMQAQNLANLLGQIGPPMKEIPQFIPAYAMMLKGLIMMIDGLPDREQIASTLEAAVAQMSGATPQGIPGAPGRPPLALPEPNGMPMVPAAISALANTPGAVSAPGTLEG